MKPSPALSVLDVGAVPHVVVLKRPLRSTIRKVCDTAMKTESNLSILVINIPTLGDGEGKEAASSRQLRKFPLPFCVHLSKDSR